MTDEEYINTQAQVMALGALVESMPLAEFIRRINRAESIGSLIDPTLYRQAQDPLKLIKGFANAACEFQKAVRRIKDDGVSFRSEYPLSATPDTIHLANDGQVDEDNY